MSTFTAPVLLLILLSSLTGCTTPAERFAAMATGFGFRAEAVAGEGFVHTVYRKSASASDTIHVYLGGDGTAWFAGLPAADPTPRHPVALDLMARDPGSALYLGRPCYHGAERSAGCTEALWTGARYSEAVVASMTAALVRLVRQARSRRVVLIGYSGGGTLAMLLAPRVPEVAAVITVAANLDIDAWTALHGYRPLAGSLNPARRPFPADRVRRLHFVGGRDTVVPPALSLAVADRLGPVRVIDRYDHACCWAEAWPALLDQAVPSAGLR